MKSSIINNFINKFIINNLRDEEQKRNFGRGGRSL